MRLTVLLHCFCVGPQLVEARSRCWPSCRLAYVFVRAGEVRSLRDEEKKEPVMVGGFSDAPVNALMAWDTERVGVKEGWRQLVS